MKNAGATKKELSHWTSKEAFDAIIENNRILGLTEGRVYLSVGKRSSLSILKKEYRIILKDFERAKRHPVLFPPSWWGITKLAQHVTPPSTNIVWDAKDAIVEDSHTLVVRNAKIERQDGWAKVLGTTRFWGRWFVIDCCPILFLAIFSTFADNKFLTGSDLLEAYAATVCAFFIWFFMQQKVNRIVVRQYATLEN